MLRIVAILVPVLALMGCVYIDASAPDPPRVYYYYAPPPAQPPPPPEPTQPVPLQPR
jgi:hypothetical protein